MKQIRIFRLIICIIFLSAFLFSCNNISIQDTNLKTDTNESTIDLTGYAFPIFGKITNISDSEIIINNESKTAMQGEMRIPLSNLLIFDSKNMILSSKNNLKVGEEIYGNISDGVGLSIPALVNCEAIFVNYDTFQDIPAYEIVKEIKKENQKYQIIVNDITSYVISSEVNVRPLKTKNIITMDDIKVGSKVLLKNQYDEEINEVVLVSE
ncbi:MAG: hypothetical protein Q4F88_04185 [Eubacteriales bacterium]|nr:hypothetical protein [Eubacteriales bacterium]